MRLLHLGFSLTLLVCLTSSAPARAGLLYTVDRTDDDAAAGACLPAIANDCSLRGAIRSANIDGQASIVMVPDGTYQLTAEGPEEEFALTGDLDIVFDSLTIQAAPGAHPVIQQLTDDRIFDVDPSAGDVVLLGPMTLLDGMAFVTSGQERGGSLNFFRGDSLHVEDVHFVGGFATDFAGCLEFAAPLNPGSLTLRNVSFTGCGTEGQGGAFVIQNGDSTVVLDHVTVESCTAGEAGGAGWIAGGSSTVVIEDSSFEHNTAAASFLQSAWGWALYITSGSLAIHRSTFAHNTVGRQGGTSGSGGGLYVSNSLLLLSNSTLSENRALTPSGFGANLTAANSTVRLEFATVKEHIPPAAFPSIEVQSPTTLDVFASVVEAECRNSGTIDSEGLNVEYPPSGAGTTQCELDHVSDVLRPSTMIQPLAGYGGPTPTHALLPGTAGWAFIVPSGLCLDTDQRGADRLSLFCHAGAFEAGSPSPGSSIFSDGFESGDVLAWSNSQP